MGSDMDDLTINRLCAEVLGIPASEFRGDDAQAMALVKRFRLDIEPEEDRWQVSSWKTDGSGRENYVYADDLNRALRMRIPHAVRERKAMSELTREQIEKLRIAMKVRFDNDAMMDALCNMALSALDVRERCAQVCDRVWQESNSLAISKIAGQLAREIRALDLGAQVQREANRQNQIPEQVTTQDRDSVVPQPASHQSPPEQVPAQSHREAQSQVQHPEPAPARGLARLCERLCYSIAESERCSDCPSLQPQARGLSAVEEVRTWERKPQSPTGAVKIYWMALRHAEELDRLREAKKDAKSHTDTIRKIEQALLPDPHDEREVSVEWLRKTIRAAIRREAE